MQNLLELPGLTLPVVTVFLVTPVAAVVGSVTDFEGERAVEVVALELTRRTVAHS